MIDVSVIIVAYKAEAELQRCLASIPKKKSIEVIVVDNNRINRGFGKGCNVGAKKAKGTYLLFLNPDCIVQNGAIEALLAKISSDASIGIVAPQLIDDNTKAYASFSAQPTAVSAPIVYSFIDTMIPTNSMSVNHWFRGMSLTKERDVGIVSGAALMISKKDFDAVGGFDETFFMYWEEVDLCRQITARNKRIVFYPKAQILHSRERSTAVGTVKVRSWFRQSRFYFFRKHFGWLYASFLETFLVAQEEWRLLSIVLLAAFLRFYRLDTLMPILGDQGRDFLAALEGLRHKELPLLGIPSSMPRFRQGPLSVWLLMAVFGGLGTDPVIAGYVAAVLGWLAVVGTYLLAERYWGKKAAVVASVFLAAAPLAVTQSRLAFHTNPIPFFSLFYIWLLTRIPLSWRQALLAGLGFSLLFQFELAIFPLSLLLLWYWWYNRSAGLRFWRFFVALLGGVSLGLLPQLIYDVTHNFQQVGLFVAWVGYRVLGFVGLTGEHTVSSIGMYGVLVRLLEYGQKFLSWGSAAIAVFLGLLIAGGMSGYGWMRYTKQRNRLVEMVVLWIILLLGGYVVHGGPSEAYFPAFFVPVALLLGWLVSRLRKSIFHIVFGLVVGISGYNAWYLVTHDFMVATPAVMGVMPEPRYGLPLFHQREVVETIKLAANNNPVSLIAIGPGSEHASFLDNYRFLLTIQGYPIDDANGVPVYIWSKSVFPVTPLIDAKTYYVGDVGVSVRL